MDKFSQILFNWFTQNPTGRDEREQGVLEHKLAVMFLLTYITIVILGTISLVIDMKRNSEFWNNMLISVECYFNVCISLD